MPIWYAPLMQLTATATTGFVVLTCWRLGGGDRIREIPGMVAATAALVALNVAMVAAPVVLVLAGY